MADDKGTKPSGGGPFTDIDPIVWVVLILLGITLVSNLFDRVGLQQKTETKNTDSQQPIVSGNDSCGLNIISPKPLQLVNNSVSVSGSVGYCDWVPKGEIALYLQVIDSTGKLISSYTPVPIGEKIPGNASTSAGLREFSYNIAFNEAPVTKTGFVIFVNPDTKKEITKTVRVPIQFKK